MQLISQHIDKDESGSVTLRPQEDEDFWHAYNLIQEGDALRASAIRSVPCYTRTRHLLNSRETGE